MLSIFMYLSDLSWKPYVKDYFYPHITNEKLRFRELGEISKTTQLINLETGISFEVCIISEASSNLNIILIFSSNFLIPLECT